MCYSCKASSRHGIRATCSLLLRYLHPAKEVVSKYANRTAQQRMMNAVVAKQETKMVNRKELVCIVLWHDNFPNKEVHAIKLWVKVDKEGSDAHFFGVDDGHNSGKAGEEVVGGEGGEEVASSEASASVCSGEEEAHEGEQIPGFVFHATSRLEDIANIWVQDLDVYDNNEPAPENVPFVLFEMVLETGVSKCATTGRGWGWTGVCNWRCAGITDVNARIQEVQGEA